MCVIAWNWQPASATPLLLLANRDEFYARPSQHLHWWPDAPVLAGRDLQAGGSWLGLSRSGRLAALTNYRRPAENPAEKPTLSRGTLVVGFLQGNMDAESYLQQVAGQAGNYQPFNLLVFDGRQLLGLESRRRRVFAIAPGVSGVSNADFDTPWPKLQRLKQGLTRQLQAGVELPDLLPLLQDTRRADAAHLPDTGLALEWERQLSAIWLATPEYGTRASSIVQWGQDMATFLEQTYDRQGLLGRTQQSFTPAFSGSGLIAPGYIPSGDQTVRRR
ncbi:MAG: NRDE family protein [Rhodoferax sp.]|nr:NRDE family protein [Rhodoferax sp.]